MSKVVPVAGTISKESFDNYSKNNSKRILLTDADVVKLRDRKIKNWENTSEIWALKFGIPTLALSNLISNLFINNLYRSKFLLSISKHTASYVSSILVTGVMSTAASATILSLTFYERLLRTSTKDDCMMCNEIKGMTSHLVIGSLIPTGLAWLSSLYHASLYHTVRVPSLDSYFKAGKKRQYFREIATLFRKSNKNTLGILTTCYCLQIFFASCVMFFQQKQFIEHIEPLKFSNADIKSIKPTS